MTKFDPYTPWYESTSDSLPGRPGDYEVEDVHGRRGMAHWFACAWWYSTDTAPPGGGFCRWRGLKKQWDLAPAYEAPLSPWYDGASCSPDRYRPGEYQIRPFPLAFPGWVVTACWAGDMWIGLCSDSDGFQWRGLKKQWDLAPVSVGRARAAK